MLYASVLSIYLYNVKSHGTIIQSVFFYILTGYLIYFFTLTVIHRIGGKTVFIAQPGFYFNKNNIAIMSSNYINFSDFSGKIFI